MMAESTSVYLSYARKDEPLVQELKMHIRLLQREGLITAWHDLDISPGVEWEKEIHWHLSNAQIILLLVSPDFMASDYCYSVEMKRALERHASGEAHVIPIILRPCNWNGAPFSKLRVLPSTGKPITQWTNRDEAFITVAEGIRQTVEGLSASKSLSSASLRIDQKSSLLLPNRSFAQTSWARPVFGKLLLFAKRYKAALGSYEQALRTQPDNPYLHLGKGAALLGLKRNNEALTAYQEAIRLSPDLSAAYEGQGKAYEQIGRQTYEELQQQARTCHEKAKQLGAK